MKKIILFFCLFFSFCFCVAQQNSSKKPTNEQVVAQMNYCISSLTHIIHNKSGVLLDYELDRLLNNLSLDQVIGMEDIKEFRGELMDCIQNLSITEEERAMSKKVLEIKRKNQVYKSISSSLSSTMLLTGGGQKGSQLGFMALVSLARAGVDYKVATGDIQTEELQAMWSLREKDLLEFSKLRTSAFKACCGLFEKYQLKDMMRLTEKTAILFDEIVSEKNPSTRIRLLLDNEHTFKMLADYYYYLGMAYVDANQYNKGKSYLDRYVTMYNKAPIFRQDEKSGCIALVKLANEPNLTAAQVKNLTAIVRKNLPNSGPAIIQSVLALYKSNQKDSAFEYLRFGIDNRKASDRDAMVMLAAKLLPDIKKVSNSYKRIVSAVSDYKSMDINSYVAFWTCVDPNTAWDKIRKVLAIDEEGVHISSNYKVDDNTIKVYSESRNYSKMEIVSFDVNCQGVFDMDYAKKKIDCVKQHPEVIYLFAKPVNKDKFQLKGGMQDSLENRDFADKFPWWTTHDKKDIVKFYKKHYTSSGGNITLELNENKDGDEQLRRVAYFDNAFGDKPVSSVAKSSYQQYRKNWDWMSSYEVSFKGKKPYNFYHFASQPKVCLKLKFEGAKPITLVYYYDKETKLWKPYALETDQNIYYKNRVRSLSKKSFEANKAFFEAQEKKEKRKETIATAVEIGIAIGLVAIRIL